MAILKVSCQKGFPEKSFPLYEGKIFLYLNLFIGTDNSFNDEQISVILSYVRLAIKSLSVYFSVLRTCVSDVSCNPPSFLQKLNKQ